MCGLDATLKCNLTRNQIMKLCQSGDPVARACGDMAGYVLGNPSKYRCVASIHAAVPFMYLHPSGASLRQKKYSWMWIVPTVPDEVPHYAISAGGYTKKTK